MDRQFLEFWGRLFLAAAAGQQPMEEISGWMAEGMKGCRGLSEIFRRAYGLGGGREPKDPAWTSAEQAFAAAWARYLDLLGLVPRAKAAALEEELGALRRKTAEQEEELGRLRRELAASRLAQGDVLQGFQELIRVQDDQFRTLSESLGRFFSGRGTGGSRPKGSAE